MPRHFVEGTELSPEEIRGLFQRAAVLKKDRRPLPPPLSGKTLGLIFEKASVRTRVSFEVAMTELGGANIYMDQQGNRLGERESVKDVANVLSCYVHALALRTFSHEIVRETARHSRVPVINGLSDRFHPCQALGDLFTVEEKLKKLDGARLAFIGDGNNVARSLAIACRQLGLEFRLAAPAGYGLDPDFLRLLTAVPGTGLAPALLEDPREAARGADVLYTDVWVSMGQEKEAAERRARFAPYRIDSKLLSLAAKTAIVMHCLPARRGEEVTDEVIDGPQSVVYDQAENRLHVQKALLLTLLS